MAILCDDCRNFKATFDPQMSKVAYGHCRAIEYPFLLPFSRKRGRAPSRPPKTASSSKKRKR